METKGSKGKAEREDIERRAKKKDKYHILSHTRNLDLYLYTHTYDMKQRGMIRREKDGD